MSAVLYLVLLLLLLGAVATFILARFRLGYESEIATILTALILVGWLLAGRSLPLTVTLSRWPKMANLPYWMLTVDDISWRLSFTFLLFVLAVFLASLTRNSQTRHEFLPPTNFPSLTLAITLSVLLSLWSDNIASLITGLVLLLGSWSLLLWTGSENGQLISKVFWQTSVLSLGALMVWLASPQLTESLTGGWDPAALPAATKRLVLAGAFAWLGAFPFIWWRPINYSKFNSAVALLHIAPVVVGGMILARITPDGIRDSSFLTLLTAFGLLGFSLGVVLVWRHLIEPIKAMGGLSLAQANLVALTGAWVGGSAAVEATIVLILAIGVLVLCTQRSQRKPSWYVVVPLAAIVGMPFSAGFQSQSALLNAWLQSGAIHLALVLAMMMILLVAAIVLVWKSLVQADRRGSRLELKHLPFQASLFILALGLVVFPNMQLSRRQLSVWLLILIPFLIGVGLGLRFPMLPELKRSIQRLAGVAIHTEVLTKAVIVSGSIIVTGVNKVASILEGEGGLLWLLVLVVVFWLVRQ